RFVFPSRRVGMVVTISGPAASNSIGSHSACPADERGNAMMKTLVGITLAAALIPSTGALAQEAHVHAQGSEQLGTVHFPTSCAAAVAPDFTRAVALLHSFGYEESRLAFQEVAAKDPVCGMTQWGIAMTYYHPIWAPPSPAELAAGKAAA